MEVFCSVCGTRLTEEDEFCARCGQRNEYYIKTLIKTIEYQSEINQTEKKVIKTSKAVQTSFSGAMLLIGITLTVLGIMENVFIILGSFASAVCAGISLVFSIIGLTRDEPTGKISMILLAISIMLALSQVGFLVLL